MAADLAAPGPAAANGASHRPIPVRPRVFVVSAIRLLRDGIVVALAGQPTVQVVGAGDLCMSPSDIACCAPDALLLDISVPGGLEIAAPIREGVPHCRIVALGVAEAEPIVMACARLGIAGFVYPEGSAHDVVTAVHAAVRGELVCSPRTAGMLLSHAGTAAPAAGAAEESLTPREQEILALLAEGMSNKEIARRLSIGSATVKNHVHSILGKLGVHRRGEAAAQLRRRSGGAAAPPVLRGPAIPDRLIHTG